MDTGLRYLLRLVVLHLLLHGPQAGDLLLLLPPQSLLLGLKLSFSSLRKKKALGKSCPAPALGSEPQHPHPTPTPACPVAEWPAMQDTETRAHV